MSRFRLAQRARQDLIQIRRKIAEHSERNADRFVRRLLARMRLLGANPYLGRSRNALKPGYRSFPVGRYVILYRVQESAVEIVHVLHGSRDLKRLFEDD